MKESGERPKHLGLAIIILAVVVMTIASSMPPKTSKILEQDVLKKAKQMGVDPFTYRSAEAVSVNPKDLATVRATAAKLKPETATQQQVDYLCQVALSATNLSSDAFSGLHMVRDTHFHGQVVETAHKAAQSTHEATVYSAINLLHHWQDPRWRQLALSHQSDPGQLFQELVTSAKK